MSTPVAASRGHDMRFGTRLAPGGTAFRLWAPLQQAVRLEVQGRGPVAMTAAGDGWFEAVSDAPAGARYRFVLDDGFAVPDPASRYQPDGPHGWSIVVDPDAYRWRVADWPGRPWAEIVLYELHVGTFTPEGTYAGAASRLDHLQALGVTAVELMPVSTFAGRHGWGYDGVLPFAPHPAYGTPDDLKAFVDAAHERGIAVFLDVVFNHFGPEGNYHSRYAPMFSHKHRSPWGDGVNFDDEGSKWVRAYHIENALFWIDEYRLDGLRLDAVQAIVDDSPVHFLAELASTVRAATPGRLVHLVLENADNDADLLDSGAREPSRYVAQWNDDIHHAMHVAVTGEHGGYYAGFAADEGLLAKAVAEGFVRQGSEIAGGSPLGTPSGHLPPTAFVSFLQNHDQIGNRVLGERITTTVPDMAPIRAAAALYLLAPQIPLLFMGEEWAATSPFPFFCDFAGELAEAVRRGRREEFAHFPEFTDTAVLDRHPDPVSASTFTAAKLDWSEPDRDPHRATLDWYRRIIAVRHREIVPLLPRLSHGGAFDRLGDHAFIARWTAGDRNVLEVEANLSDRMVPTGRVPGGARVIWEEGKVIGANAHDIARDHPGPRLAEALGPWSVRWSVAG